ncbi:MAG: MBL fold metallo-hydrolase, partial [Desulfonatronovibrionaceae bacterium]
MPSLTLKNKTWQEVPGARRIKIFPFFRKPSVITSNSYVLRFPEAVVVVDPGADPVQTRKICSLISRELETACMPVYLWLTHAHVDHFMALDAFTIKSIPFKTACHESGAAALEAGDRAATAADLCGYSLQPVQDIIRLNQSRLPDDIKAQLDDPQDLKIFHTPGHTPDSLCFKVGKLLLTGDLSYAALPGIAGMPGWDSSLLRDTASWMEKYLQQGHIAAVLPGHGREVHPQELEQIMKKTRQSLSRHPDIVPLDVRRAGHLYNYALTLLDEAGTILSIMGGSLLKVSYYLDLLEEKDKARQADQLMPM